MNNKLNETMKRLKRAFDLLCKISVKEDDVERMAVAKRELQMAYAEQKALMEQEGEDGQAD